MFTLLGEGFGAAIALLIIFTLMGKLMEGLLYGGSVALTVFGIYKLGQWLGIW
jgi:hypothetical protein